MPMYDYKCPNGHEFEGLYPVGVDIVPCRECDAGANKVWVTKPSNIVGDEIDYIDENLGPEPIRIRSKAERRRIMKERGLEEFIRHTGVPGTDKSPHTTNWGSISQVTLDGAKAMLERVGGMSPTEPSQEELDRAVTAGEIEVPIVVEGGRTINVHVGKIYRGTLDPSVLKKG